MNAHETLLEQIRRSSSPLVGPQPLSHSQELEDSLPRVRRHVGPRPWYQSLEGPTKAPTRGESHQ